MHRDMSYRKPVPTYIPSPPPSPPSSPDSNIARLSFSLDSLAGRQLPPLPGDWRQIIEQTLVATPPAVVHLRRESTIDGRSSARTSDATTQDGRLSFFTASSYHGYVQPEASTSQAWTDNGVEPPNPGDLSSSPMPEKRPKRRLHQNYRPPTPPLPAHHKRLRSQDDEPESCNMAQQEYRGDDGRYHVNNLIASGRPIQKPRPGVMVRANSSFRTQATQSSVAGSDFSTAWSGGQTTCVSESDAASGELPVALPAYMNHSQISVLLKPIEDMTIPSESATPANSWWSSLRIKLRSLKTTFADILC
ncbi:hypothetical protein BD779DRAFT_1491695 [Infundibulicybe gibba]|nr:hypothetical protein BD779DRAFT_1491695 [Infundibulicybe gibba]